MGQHQIAPVLPMGWVDENRTVPDDDTNIEDTQIFSSIAELDAELVRKDEETFTAERLAGMTVNDKQYAVRITPEPPPDDPGEGEGEGEGEGGD